jgi:hypothetical protein
MSEARPTRTSSIELVKSALVVPLVVAIVLAVALGLVQLAHHRQIALGKPDPTPATKTEDGSFVPNPAFAQVNGETWFRGGSTSRALAVHPEANTLSWKFPIDTSGRYKIELDYACPPAGAGSTVAISIGGQTLHPTIHATKDAKTFHKESVGEVTIASPAWYVLQLAPEKILHPTIVNLRGIRLVPVKA